MTWIWPALALLACGKDPLPDPPDEEPTAEDTGGETADTEETVDTGDTDDTAPPTDTTEPESCGAVTFTPTGGDPVDYTEVFTVGDPVALSTDGALTFCAGAWFVRLTIDAEVSVTGLGTRPEATVLSGGEAGSVIIVRGSGASVHVENVTLDRGAALGVGNERGGGGVRCEDSGTVSVQSAIFTNHRAYDGAALAATPGCAVTIRDATFADNEAEDDGGAIRLDNTDAALRDVRFEDNRARDCGALFINESTVLVEGAHFEGNTSTDTQGGAILHYFGELTVRDASFVGNDASGFGGALSLFGDAALEQVSFTGNATTEGGAIYLYTSYGALTCAGCGFADNAPDDVATDLGDSYTFGDDSDFSCDSDGCRASGS